MLGNALLEPIVGDHADDVINPVSFAKSIQARHRKTGICSKHDIRFGIGFFELSYDPLKNAFGTVRGMGVARSKHRRKRKTRFTVKNQKRMIHRLMIIAVKKTQLLTTVSRVIRGVKIENDFLRRLGVAV